MELFFIGLLIIFGSISPSSASTEGIEADVFLFLDGFAAGIEVDVGNLKECARDINMTLDDFNLAWYNISEGLYWLSPSEVEAGIVELGSGIREVALVYTNCGVNKLAADIERLGEKLFNGTSGIISVITKEAINIWSHGADLTNDFKNAIAFAQSQDYYNCGLSTGEIVGILLDVNLLRSEKIMKHRFRM